MLVELATASAVGNVKALEAATNILNMMWVATSRPIAERLKSEMVKQVQLKVPFCAKSSRMVHELLFISQSQLIVCEIQPCWTLQWNSDVAGTLFCVQGCKCAWTDWSSHKAFLQWITGFDPLNFVVLLSVAVLDCLEACFGEIVTQNQLGKSLLSLHFVFRVTLNFSRDTEGKNDSVCTVSAKCLHQMANAKWSHQIDERHCMWLPNAADVA